MDENEFMMDFTRIDDILAIHEDIYHVSIIDPQGNVVASKLKKTGNTKTREELFGIDLCIIRQIFDLGNDIHGRTYCVIIRRENKQHVVHFLDNFQRCHNFIVYITCYSIPSFSKISEISDKISKVVDELAVV